MDDPPVRDKAELFERLDAAIEQGRAFCAEHDIHIDQVATGDSCERWRCFNICAA